MSSSKELKALIRERVWRLLEEKGVARFPKPVRGRIPNFVGAEEAAARLAQLDVWRKARVVKVNPDSPQKPVRLLALKQGKVLVFATPRMREGFLVIDPRKVPPHSYEHAATIRGAFRWGRRLHLDELRDLGIDLMVTGSVAVDLRGSRLGKGEGYAELEYAILRTVGALSEDTPVATTVHDLQVVREIPREPHDLTMDIIATPTRVIVVSPRPPKPPGVLWDRLPCRKLEEIPLLRDLARRLGIEKPCSDSPR